MWSEKNWNSLKLELIVKNVIWIVSEKKTEPPIFFNASRILTLEAAGSSYWLNLAIKDDGVS